MSKFSQDPRYYYPLSDGNQYNNEGSIGKHLQNGIVDTLNNAGISSYISYNEDNEIDYIGINARTDLQLNFTITNAYFNYAHFDRISLGSKALDNYKGMPIVLWLYRGNTIFQSYNLQVSAEDVPYLDEFVKEYVNQATLRYHELILTDSMGNHAYIVGYENKTVDNVQYKVLKIHCSSLGNVNDAYNCGTGYFFLDLSSKSSSGGYRAADPVSTTYGMSVNHWIYIHTTDDNAEDYLEVRFLMLGNTRKMSWYGITNIYSNVNLPAWGYQGNKKVEYVKIGFNADIYVYFTDGSFTNCKQEGNIYTLEDKLIVGGV